MNGAIRDGFAAEQRTYRQEFLRVIEPGIIFEGEGHGVNDGRFLPIHVDGSIREVHVDWRHVSVHVVRVVPY